MIPKWCDKCDTYELACDCGQCIHSAEYIGAGYDRSDYEIVTYRCYECGRYFDVYENDEDSEK